MHNKYLKTFLLGILAGVAIGFGGLLYLCCLAYGHKIIGSILFSFGLLLVTSVSLFLYTGKIGYVFSKDGPKPLDLLLGYVGNIIGASSLGIIMCVIPSIKGSPIAQNAYYITASRDVLSSNGETWYNALLLSILCGVLVFVAVDVNKRKPGLIGTLILILSVTTFVIAGFEHCIANSFYFFFGNNWSWGVVLNLLITTIGNSIGAILTYFITHLALDKKEEKILN